MKTFILILTFFTSPYFMPASHAEVTTRTTTTPKTDKELLQAFDQTIEQMDLSAQQNYGIQNYTWTELELFNALLYRAMALDPGPTVQAPPETVPKELFAAALNDELFKKWDALKKSSVPQKTRAQFEFEQYSHVVERILAFRKTRGFPAARSIAKRGELESALKTLREKILVSSEANTPLTELSLKERLTELKTTTASMLQRETKKDPFSNGHFFMGVMLTLLIGFSLGITAFKFNPTVLDQWFTKIFPKPEPQTPKPTFHYEAWLRDFEGILGRMKNSQVNHERRIEEVVHASEKITQQALALYADARIKNEANLEHRMGTLLREIQTQLDHSQKLQASDRVQIQLMLEHCLKLCDSIESKTLDIKAVA